MMRFGNELYHEIMEIGVICSNLVEKSPPLQQFWAEP
jgi:hypothetical protein